MKPTLKDLLKPPFGRNSVNGIADQFWPLLSADTYRAFTFKGLNCDSIEYDSLRSEFIAFVVDALNEKWERDYGEPLRWMKCIIDIEHETEGFYYKCPKCKGTAGEESDYCPNCGRRLLSPKEAKEDE